MGRRHASLIPFANKWFIRADGGEGQTQTLCCEPDREAPFKHTDIEPKPTPSYSVPEFAGAHRKLIFSSHILTVFSFPGGAGHFSSTHK